MAHSRAGERVAGGSGPGAVRNRSSARKLGQNGGDPGRLPAGAGRRRRGHQSAEHPPSDLCPALAWLRSPTSPVEAEASAGDGRFQDRCTEALGPDPAGSWGSPHHLAGRSFRFACAPLPERTVFARPPTAVVSGLLRGSSVGRSLWLLLGLDPLRSAAVKATLDLRPRPVNRDSRDPQAYPPTFFVVPRTPRGCPPVGHRSMHSGAAGVVETVRDDRLRPSARGARRRPRGPRSPSPSTAPRS